MAIFKDGGRDHTDRSQGDRKRHRKLVEDAIKNNLGDIVAEESIISQSKAKKIKIPIKGIKEYQFAYGKNTPGAATGSGKEQRGQVVGKAGKDSQSQPGQGQAGDHPGEDVFETEITLDELVEYLFEDLALPDMERKKFAQTECFSRLKRSGYQRKGIPARLDKKKTLIEKLKRAQAAYRRYEDEPELPELLPDQVSAERIPFREDDLRYQRVKEDRRPHSNAVVFFIMDTSGSMDQTRKYLARSFFFLQHRFICWKYAHVEVVFIAHSTDAKEVNERDFFHRGADGGTFISSGFARALEIIEQRFNPANWNIYVFHCSDGDNWGEDNAKAIAHVKTLCRISNLVGYGEITTNPGYGGTIRREYEKNIHDDNFVIVVMGKKEDVWPAFKQILDKDAMAGRDEVWPVMP